MVGIVGAPAQSQLGQITRADKKRALLVGYIHKYLRSLTGLHILIGHIKHIHIVTYVPHMLSTCGYDIYLPKLGAYAFRQPDSARLCVICRPEAGHCHTDYIFFRQPHELKCTVRDKQGKR